MPFDRRLFRLFGEAEDGIPHRNGIDPFSHRIITISDDCVVDMAGCHPAFSLNRREPIRH